MPLRDTVRAALLLKAWRADPKRRDEVWPHDGLGVVMDPAVTAPSPRFGWSPQVTLCDALDVRPGERLLDLLCAGGLVSLAAARRGAAVVAVDPDERALACLRRGALMAGVPVPELTLGEGPEAADHATFDVVTWTAPFLSATRSHPRDARLVRGDEAAVGATLRDVAGRLNRGGRLLVPWPDRDARGWLADAFADAGLRFSATSGGRYRVIGPVSLYRAWTPRRGERPGEVGASETLPGAGAVRLR